jgi:hypothetical protein
MKFLVVDLMILPIELFDDILPPIPEKRSFLSWDSSPRLEIALVELRAQLNERIPHNLYNIANIYGGRNLASLTLVISPPQEQFINQIISLQAWKNIRVIVLDALQKVENYNRLLQSSPFWDHFVGEFVLITQPDAMIFKEIGDEFFEFDYVGAPWTHRPALPTHPQVGNGGYSLRKLQVMKDFSFYHTRKRSLEEGESIPRQLDAETIAADLRNVGLRLYTLLQDEDRIPIPEDVYWSDHAVRLPSEELASTFAVEWLFTTEIPTALHQMFFLSRMGNYFRVFQRVNAMEGLNPETI